MYQKHVGPYVRFVLRMSTYITIQRRRDRPCRVIYSVIWTKKEPALASLGEYVRNRKDNTFSPGGFHLLRIVILYIHKHHGYFIFENKVKECKCANPARNHSKVLRWMTQRQMIPKWKYYTTGHRTTCAA
jgi:hypothetical protein